MEDSASHDVAILGLVCENGKNHGNNKKNLVLTSHSQSWKNNRSDSQKGRNNIAHAELVMHHPIPGFEIAPSGWVNFAGIISSLIWPEGTRASPNIAAQLKAWFSSFLFGENGK